MSKGTIKCPHCGKEIEVEIIGIFPEQNRSDPSSQKTEEENVCFAQAEELKTRLKTCNAFSKAFQCPYYLCSDGKVLAYDFNNSCLDYRVFRWSNIKQLVTVFENNNEGAKDINYVVGLRYDGHCEVIKHLKSYSKLFPCPDEYVKEISSWKNIKEIMCLGNGDKDSIILGIKENGTLESFPEWSEINSLSDIVLLRDFSKNGKKRVAAVTAEGEVCFCGDFKKFERRKALLLHNIQDMHPDVALQKDGTLIDFSGDEINVVSRNVLSLISSSYFIDCNGTVFELSKEEVMPLKLENYIGVKHDQNSGYVLHINGDVDRIDMNTGDITEKECNTNVIALVNDAEHAICYVYADGTFDTEAERSIRNKEKDKQSIFTGNPAEYSTVISKSVEKDLNSTFEYFRKKKADAESKKAKLGLFGKKKLKKEYERVIDHCYKAINWRRWSLQSIETENT